MDQHLITLLTATQQSDDNNRKQAEDQLQDLYNNPDFPLHLCAIASSNDTPTQIQQSALLVLKNFVLAGWSDSFDEFRGEFLVPDPNKPQIRNALLDIATSEAAPRKTQNAASLVVSKIASVDYPDEWPEVLTKLLHNIGHAQGHNSLHGSLKVLSELVEDGFDQDQFFRIAQDLVGVLHQVATSEVPLQSRALAVNVFRGCFDILEMILEDHKSDVKKFAEQIVGNWMPFLLQMTQMRLPERPRDIGSDDTYAGLVKLKTQIFKTLMRIRILFPSLVSPQGQALFSATWDDLLSFRDSYEKSYIYNDSEGRLEDADGMPYTLDFLVLEELDFLRAIIGSPNIRKALEQQLRDQSQRNWIIDLLDVAVPYAQITSEEEGMWEIDVNVFLSEETSVTANYTSRTACGDLAVKIGEWLPDSLTTALLGYMKHLFSSETGWRRREAALCIFGHVLDDWRNLPRIVEDPVSASLLEYVRPAIDQQESRFLRARALSLAGVLAITSRSTFFGTAEQLLDASIHTLTSSDSEVVQVSCIRAIACYLERLPSSATQPKQSVMLTALSRFLATRDASDLTESDELILSLLETLRETLKVDIRICTDGNGLDLLFQIASTLAASITVTGSVNEIFEEICLKVKALGDTSYALFISKVLPNLMGAFDVGHMTQQEPLTTLAADMLSLLTSEASSASLPANLVPTILPKILPLLLTTPEADIQKPLTATLRHVLTHTPQPLLAWHDPAPSASSPTAQKSGLDCVLLVIDRLLQPTVEDYAAAEVGYLASALVTAAGSTAALAPYLTQLLRAVAFRLATAEKASLIQSLILVFAGLCLNNAKDVIDFLASPSIQLHAQNQSETENALHTILPLWLFNSSDFTGHEHIRTNILALSRIYELHDPRVQSVQCKGELIVEKATSDRIMTRSRARAVPQRWTSVSAEVKIVKVLVEELGSLMASSGGAAGLGVQGALHDAGGGLNGGGGGGGGMNGSSSGLAQGAADDDDDDEDEDSEGEWEDEPGAGVLDLGIPGMKEQLMGLGGVGGEEGEFRVRQPDDETQGFLVGWFRQRAGEQGFGEVYAQLSEDERGKLGQLG